MITNTYLCVIWCSTLGAFDSQLYLATGVHLGALCMQEDVVFWASLAINIVEDRTLNAEGRERSYWDVLHAAMEEGLGRPLMKLALAATWLSQVNHVSAFVGLGKFLETHLMAAIQRRVCHISVCKLNRLVTAGCRKPVIACATVAHYHVASGV